MAITNNKISAILEEQIPDFIREDHDNFVQFLKSYYEFLESESPPTRLSLIVDNPFPTIYNPINNPYGGQFQIGETIQQKASSDDPTEVTASAKVFAWSGDATAQTAIITSFGGTSKTFIKDVEIVGEKSGAKFFPVDKTESLKAGSTRASLDLLGTKDIDETLDDYVQYIKNEFAVNLPLTLHRDSDTRKVLKNIRDFYKARGTENSFKFLFRLLYGEDISIYIPETDIIRASDANWKNITVIRVAIDSIDPRTKQSVTISDLVGRKIKGEISKATALVEKAVEIDYAGSKFSELELSDKLGTFVTNEHIETDNVGDGTIVRARVYGLMNSINITDPGSNYVTGDRVVVNSDGDGVGAIAEVATTNATSGAITSIKIIDPGYSYINTPTLDMTTPHNADAGAARFAAGPLETIFYNDFSQYTDANSFFAESDNRGAKSNVGPSTPHPYGSDVPGEAYNDSRWVVDPSKITSNSIGNFVTVPGIDEGLKGYWKMNSYYHKDATINTADGTANDGHDPVANNTFKGPRVGDITFVANPNYDTLSDVQLNYINYSYTNAMAVPDRTGANTYLSDGWIGFQPIVHDDSGQGHHARVASWRGTTPNLVPAGYQDFSRKPESLYPIALPGSAILDPPDKYPISQFGADPEASINTSFSYTGSSSLEYKITNSGATYVAFANNLPVVSSYEFRDEAWNGQWVSKIPKGKKWIFSYYAYSDSDIVPEFLTVYFFGRNMEDPLANVSYHRAHTTFSAPRQWERFEMIIDLTFDLAPTIGQLTSGEVYSRYSWGGLAEVGNDLKANEIDSSILVVGSSSSAITRSVGNTVLYDGFSLKEYDEFRPTIDPSSDVAFANTGVFGADSTSIKTQGDGGLVLMPHDDISSANTQTWSFWFNPSEKPTGTMNDQLGSGSEMIVSRDTTSHWSWSMNAYTSSTATTGEYIDTLFSYPNAKFDNGNSVGYYQKLANSAGYYPGTNPGLYTGGGTVRANTWNMFTLTIDYTNLVANVYIFNTTDGLLLANGFTLDSRFGPDTISSPNIVPMAMTGQAPSSAYAHTVAAANIPWRELEATHQMSTRTVEQAGDPVWQAGYPVDVISAQLNSKTAGAGNTARAEVIRDTPGANSYVTGNAFRLYNANVSTAATAPDGKMSNYIWNYFMPGPAGTYYNRTLRKVDDPLGTRESGINPYLMEIPKGKRWIFSYYVKSSKVAGDVSAATTKPVSSDYDSGLLSLLKRKNADGTANTWHTAIWKSNAWYASDFGLGYNTMPQYNTGGTNPNSTVPATIGESTGLESGSHRGGLGAGVGANAAIAGTWFRKHQFFDLRHANTYYGYGGWGGTLASTRVIDDAFYSAAITNKSNWADIQGTAPNGMVTIYTGDTWGDPALYVTVGSAGDVAPRHRKLEANFNLMGDGAGEPVPPGDNPFSGHEINEVVLRWRANTTAPNNTGDLDSDKLIGREAIACWTSDLLTSHSDGTFGPQLETNTQNHLILRWTTEEDATMGGTGGNQIAKAWLSSPGSIDLTGASWNTEYWRMHKIPTWRERTITSVEFQIFRDLVSGDAYDIGYITFGKTPTPAGNEVDALTFQYLAGDDEQDIYVDGIMLEEAAEGQFEPSPYAFPNQGTETGALFLGTGIPAQGRAVKLGEKSESANGDMFVTEGDQRVHGRFDETRYYDKALSWAQVEHLFANPGGRFDKVLSGDWKALNQHGTFYSPAPGHIPTSFDFFREKYVYDQTAYAEDGSGRAISGEIESERKDYAGGTYLRIGNSTDPGNDGVWMWTTKNIPYDPNVHYKMSVRAKDEGAAVTSNALVGIIGISNTGVDVIDSGNPSTATPAGGENFSYPYSLIQERGEETAGLESTFGPGWFTYTGVYGGNTSAPGLVNNPPNAIGHGGNTIQDGTGYNKQEYAWLNPVKLHGSESAATQQGTGNTTFIRPTFYIQFAAENDSTSIDYVKIEQQKDAILTAEIGAEFKQAGEYLDDSGKIGTSPVSNWRPKFIQDDRFYQIYSYVIRSGFSIGTYKEIVKKLVHPAGLIMFGQVDFQTLVSVTMNAFSQTFSGEILDLLRAFYMGAESSLLSDYADVPISGRGVGYHSQFGLDIVGEAEFNLDAAHGVTPHGAGKNTPGSPGWIAWDQSPLTSPL